MVFPKKNAAAAACHCVIGVFSGLGARAALVAPLNLTESLNLMLPYKIFFRLCVSFFLYAINSIRLHLIPIYYLNDITCDVHKKDES